MSPTATGGVARGVQPSSLVRYRRAALGSAALLGVPVPCSAARRRPGPRPGPSPGSSVPAARAPLQSAGAARERSGDCPPASFRRAAVGGPRRRGRWPVDVVVVGGGVTGTGVALDAASRGLSVVLLERADLAVGHQSLVVEARPRRPALPRPRRARPGAGERPRARRPHGNRPRRTWSAPLPFLVPDVAGRDVTALAAAGGRLGDAVRLSVPGGRGRCAPPAGCRPAEASRLVPAVRPGRGGVVFWDGQLTDDARLVVALARTAAAHGARMLTGAAVTRRRRRRRARRRRRRARR